MKTQTSVQLNKQGKVPAFSLIDVMVAILLIAIGLVGSLQSLQSIHRIHQKVENHVKDMEQYYQKDTWQEFT